MQGPWKGRSDQARGVYIRVVMHKKWWGEGEITEWLSDLGSDNGATEGEGAREEQPGPSRGQGGGKS